MKDLTNQTLFGKYFIVSCLGTGSFGTVYLSKHTILETYCAVKCIPKLSASEVSLLSEAKLLTSLHHPGIPQIYDIYEDKNFFYLIEEYINGESLDEFLLHQPHISQYLFMDFCLQLCHIFQYLHNMQPSPILYLDLKPEHIMVCGTQIKLIDFNVSTCLSNLGNICNLFGNKEFSAPELFTGAAPNFLSDIYSIGKIMHYLSTHVEPSISPKFHKIIQKAMCTEPSGRFETVDQLISAITQQKKSGQTISRTQIAAVGSHSGCGCTHIAISLVSALNYMGHPAVYYEKDNKNSLQQMAPYLLKLHENNGMFCYRFFKGYPNFGAGIQMPENKTDICVYDYGGSIENITNDMDYIIYICSSSLWHRHEIYEKYQILKQMDIPIKIICNLGQIYTAQELCRAFSSPVYTYTFDKNAFAVTKEKQQFVSGLLSLKRREHLFFHFEHKN